jgi:hypothetical protein
MDGYVSRGDSKSRNLIHTKEIIFHRGPCVQKVIHKTCIKKEKRKKQSKQASQATNKTTT